MPYLKYNLQLFAQDGDGGEKTEEPTAKKLEDARKKGQTSKSVDLTTAVSLLVFFLLLKFYIGYLGNGLMSTYNDYYRHISDYTNEPFNLQISCSFLGQAILDILLFLLPFLALSFVATVLTLLVQVKWKISFEPMKPDLKRFDPISGMKRLFSKDKLMQLLTSVAKIIVIFLVVYNYLQDKWHYIMDLYHFSLSQAVVLVGDVIVNIGLRISLLFFVIGMADLLYQKWKFHNDMKMTKQEVKDE